LDFAPKSLPVFEAVMVVLSRCRGCPAEILNHQRHELTVPILGKGGREFLMSSRRLVNHSAFETMPGHRESAIDRIEDSLVRLPGSHAGIGMGTSETDQISDPLLVPSLSMKTQPADVAVFG
jgi:hypothetical protein